MYCIDFNFKWINFSYQQGKVNNSTLLNAPVFIRLLKLNDIGSVNAWINDKKNYKG